MRVLRVSLPSIFISIIFVGCGLVEQIGSNPQDEVATRVAATLDALGVGKEVPETESPPIKPTTAPTQDQIQVPIQKIVYTDDENLWIFEIDTAPRQLTHGGGVELVRISSDGGRIAFTRRNPAEGNSELYVINSDGSDETLLLSRLDLNELYPSPAGTEGFDIGSFSFQPGSYRLYFNTLEVFEGLGYRNTNDLFMIDVVSGELTGILPAQAGGKFVFSPNGSKIAIIRPDSLSIINSDGTDYLPEIFSYSPVCVRRGLACTR
jgi:dipeptidyl aminopeptidase/acylaminoacyl peptidase